MQLEQIRTRMQHQAAMIQALVAGVDAEQARWKPYADSWSMLEVMCHLVDEEREDFRTRLDHILTQAEGMPPGIDPQGWVMSRGYNQRDFSEMVRQFAGEREKSITYLSRLENPDWDLSISGPWGTIHAGDMLLAWANHDLLHLRQLVELQWAYAGTTLAPYSRDYAGEW
ncbi:MAG: DinB family protein [Anaerolineaceae bacterium]|nr:DinB family protein [Anaerolineaceae bacterium]